MTFNENTSRGCHFLPRTRTDMTKIVVDFGICLGMRLKWIITYIVWGCGL